MNHRDRSATNLMGRLCAFAPLREAVLRIGFAAAICIPFSADAQNWDRFRGPNGAGQGDAKSIPVDWEKANYLWKRELVGLGHSSPVIWGDRVFVTSADPQTAELIVTA